jgi:16S rRNA (cytosine967-C5)-methyltransferase
MKDWGLAHRFAGSGDRAGISSLVYDALRRKASSTWLMGEETPRAEVLGALRQTRGLYADAVAALFTGQGHAPPSLTDAERTRLETVDLSSAPAHVAGDFPEWLTPQFEASFGADAAEEGRALADRAPVDLRANLLKTTRDRALAALAHLSPQPTALSPVGLRIAIRPDGRGPALAAEPAYVKGFVEVRKSPRCWRKPSPACRCSTSAQGQAARRWRWRPPWTITARSMRPTRTGGG